MDIGQELLNLKEKIENAKTEKATVNGKLQSITERLEGEHGCTTVVQAKELVKKLQTEKEQLEDKLETGMKKLREAYS